MLGGERTAVTFLIFVNAYKNTSFVVYIGLKINLLLIILSSASYSNFLTLISNSCQAN